MNCYTVGGYAEDYQDENGKQYYYNSCYIIDREGGLFLNYRKSFLYETDKIWASEGQGFKAFEISNHEGKKFKATVGICMDINPYEF